MGSLGTSLHQDIERLKMRSSYLQVGLEAIIDFIDQKYPGEFEAFTLAQMQKGAEHEGKQTPQPGNTDQAAKAAVEGDAPTSHTDPDQPREA